MKRKSSPDSSPNRRKSDRLPIAIPMFVRGTDENGKAFLEFATAIDISASGVRVALRRPVSPGSRVVLEIPSTFPHKVPSRKASKVFRAKSIRMTSEERFYIVGLKFARPIVAVVTNTTRKK